MVLPMRASIPALTLAIALSAAPVAAQNAAPTAPPAAAPAVNWTETQWILYGRQVAEWFFAGQTDSVLAHSAPDVLAMKAWASELMPHCREPKLERTGKARFFGNVAEDLSRLLAPLL